MGQDAELLAVAGAGGAPPVIISNGSAWINSFITLAGLTSADAGEGVSSQATYEGRSTLKLHGGANYNAANRAGRYRTNAPKPAGDRRVISIVFNPVSVGAVGSGTNYLYLRYTFASGKAIYIQFHSDTTAIDDSSDVRHYYTAPTLGAWNILTADMTGLLTPGSEVADFYLNNLLLVAGLDIGRSTGDPIDRFYSLLFSRDNPVYTAREAYHDLWLIGDKFQGET